MLTAPRRPGGACTARRGRFGMHREGLDDDVLPKPAILVDPRLFRDAGRPIIAGWRALYRARSASSASSAAASSKNLLRTPEA